MILQCSCCQHTVDTSKHGETVAFCPTCGAVLFENGMARTDDYCRECGKHMPRSSSYCPSCNSSARSSSIKTGKGTSQKDKSANMKLYAEWMKYSDLPAENIKEITGNDLNIASSGSKEDYEEKLASDGTSYNAAPFVGPTAHWRTADKIGAGVSAFLKNVPLLVSLVVNILFLIVIILLLRSQLLDNVDMSYD